MLGKKVASSTFAFCGFVKLGRVQYDVGRMSSTWKHIFSNICENLRTSRSFSLHRIYDGSLPFSESINLCFDVPKCSERRTKLSTPIIITTNTTTTPITTRAIITPLSLASFSSKLPLLSCNTRTYATNQNVRNSVNQDDRHKGFDVSKMKRRRNSSKIILFFIFLFSAAGIIELIYKLAPKQSLGDRIRALIFGYPYRNYETIDKGTFSEAYKPNGIYIPQEKHFHVLIPTNFVTPGLTLSERTMLRFHGRFVAKDLLDQSMIVEWQRIEGHLKDNGQSLLTPIDEILKGTAYNTVNRIMDLDPNFHIQRLEHISKSNGIMLDPLPFFSEHDAVPEMVCMISKINKGSESIPTWIGDLWLIRNPYVYHFNLVVPSQLVKASLLKNSSKPEEFEKYISSVSSRVSDEKCKKKIEEVLAGTTSDPTEMSKQLRRRLLELAHGSLTKSVG